MKIMKGNTLLDTITKVDIVNTPVKQKDVDFIDYDGTLLYSYTLDEIQKITELPPLPTQPGLICQEWNWSLEDIKTHNRRLIVGATYITDDGKTRLYIDLTSEDRLDVPLHFRQSIANGVEVNWGDGSPVETFESTSITTKHTYTKIGNYIITLNPINDCVINMGDANGSLNIFNSSSKNYLNTYYYSNILTKLNIGKNVKIDNGPAFQYCRALSSVTIPRGITNITVYVFHTCHSLSSLVIPNGVTSIGSRNFVNCYSLVSISIPNNVTNINSQMFDNCRSLSNVTIPNGVTSIGEYAFRQCYSLSSIVIPDGVTSIDDNAFYSCYTLSNIIISNSVTSIGNSAFSSCYLLSNIIIPNNIASIGNSAFSSCFLLSNMIIPNGVTSINDSTFSTCYLLSNVTIPNGVTSIGAYAFRDCYSLSSIVIPNSVTSIGEVAFYWCYGMKKYDFSTHTQIPTLASINAFQNIPKDCKIIVPDALYDEWIVATNWSNYADYIVKVSEVYMSILEEIMPTGETFDGLGGTEEEIESVADEILGNK